MCRLYLIRHGETEWNVAGKIQGHEDSPLTKKGLDQARQAAQQFKDHHFAAVFSSDLIRAQRTAEIIAAEHQLTVQTTQFLREKAYGKFAGLKFPDFKKKLKNNWRSFANYQTSKNLHLNWTKTWKATQR